MFSGSDDMQASALSRRGWSISAIARHLGCDRKTVRAYLSGERVVGVPRRSSVPDPMAPYLDYVKARFVDDPHLWATALFDEVVELGYERAYPSFARQLRLAGLRPHCEACSGVKGRESIEIDHPAGDEILCRKPHRISYVDPGIMRRGARAAVLRAVDERLDAA